MPVIQDVEKFFRRLKRYDRTYFQHKFYDSSVRTGIESMSDFRRLAGIDPDLHVVYERKKPELDERLLPSYKEYVSGVSNEIMAVSLELSRFLLFLCERRNPGSILDLGSGFSSYVFRSYARTAPRKPVVWSVDDSIEWLDKTRSYLVSKGLNTENLVPWEEFESLHPDPFDFILYDLGGFDFRKSSFEKVLNRMAKGGVLVVDDMHSADYGLYVKRKIAEHGMSKYSIRRYTHDRFNRYSLLVFSGK